MGSKVSVIIPVYKVEKYLRKCLDSVVGQTYSNLEIILIDDGSPDNCGAICEEYAARDPRVVVIHKENGGLSAARNDGIQRATGEWTAFVDSDDWCELDYYEQMLKTAEIVNTDVCCASGYILETEKNTKHVIQFSEPFSYSDADSLRQCMIGAISGGAAVNYGPPWDKLYRTAFLKENGLEFDTTCKASEDVWFNFQVFHKARSVTGCIAVGYHYRFAPMSITRGYNPRKASECYDTLTKVHHYVDEHHLPNDVHQAADGLALSFIVTSMNCCYCHPANPKAEREIASDINYMKTWPYFHEAIWSKNYSYLSRRQVALQFALRLPWAWPAEFLHWMKDKLG